MKKLYVSVFVIRSPCPSEGKKLTPPPLEPAHIPCRDIPGTKQVMLVVELLEEVGAYRLKSLGA